MKTTGALLCASLLTTIVGCDTSESGVPAYEREIVFDGSPVESVDELPEEVQALVYEVWDKVESDPSPEFDFRAKCTAKCEVGSVSMSGDSCSCVDYVGCAATSDGKTTGKSCAGKTYSEQ